MLPKALFAVALASSSATAFLVLPPTDSQAAKSAKGDNGIDGDATDFSAATGASLKPDVFEAAVVTVDCPGCGLTVFNKAHHEKDMSTAVLDDVPNFLNFFLRVERREDGDHIVINDLELYPEVDIHNSALHAMQLPVHPRKHHSKHHEGKHHDEHHEEKEDEMKREMHHPKEKHDLRNRLIFEPVPLGYSLQMHTVGKDASNDMDVVALILQIIGVNDVFIQGIPAVSINLIRKPEGTLIIGSVGIEGDSKVNDVHPVPLDGPHGPPHGPHGPHHGPPPPHDHPHGPPPPEENSAAREELEKKLSECTNILCRWKVILSSHVKPHGCGGMRKGKGSHHDESHHDEVPEEGHKDVPAEALEEGHDEKHMPYHGHHHHRHSWVRLLGNFVSHILVPVLIGVSAGVGSSVAGMIVGSLIVRLWRMFFRRPQQKPENLCSNNSKAAVCEAGAVDEKAGLMTAAEAEDELPLYKDEEEEKEAKEGKHDV
ncbi:hypothetical protein CMQ_4720 [Grosmannia clavigera kw1407]|uniref:DUF7728 domain-containing protein n=1 Tax=Grosmannia clavigera (strain kw1407 / UAMH 11150) TaxID=655863 RepID=F0XUM6_GROCL|nr:uncharacterized protein CMQ_4720 [Grosmannia clavigera kw1407]EFW98868.1 hypothetical protein CMQ_4720 [Grosmannia clavigera kw1407]